MGDEEQEFSPGNDVSTYATLIDVFLTKQVMVLEEIEESEYVECAQEEEGAEKCPNNNPTVENGRLYGQDFYALREECKEVNKIVIIFVEQFKCFVISKILFVKNQKNVFLLEWRAIRRSKFPTGKSEFILFRQDAI